MLIMLGGVVLLAKLLGIETVHSDKRGLWLVQLVPPWSKANCWGKKALFCWYNCASAHFFGNGVEILVKNVKDLFPNQYYKSVVDFTLLYLVK